MFAQILRSLLKYCYMYDTDIMQIIGTNSSAPPYVINVTLYSAEDLAQSNT